MIMFSVVTFVWGQFIDCHDDPAFDPDEGPLSELQFTWLGALQYIHGMFFVFWPMATQTDAWFKPRLAYEFFQIYVQN